MTKFDIGLLSPGGEVCRCPASWQALEGDRLFRFSVLVPDARDCTYTAADLFECLCELRRHLEPEGWRVLCKGARREAWPSGMGRDMGAGRKVYLLRRKPLTALDLVETFEPADVTEVTTLADQRAFASAFFGHPV